ncbi:MAG: nuclear transport factor 2 family protein [Planctomycetota bacterium JB042]
MNIDVPRPVAAYLEAEKAKDARALARCFDAGAVVRDEGREHRGVAAIEAWHREANATAPYVVEPLEAFVSGEAVVVRARVSGEFPGSPTELRHHFVLEGDRISSLEVTP